MTKNLWLINYESSQWCGGGSYVVVAADSEEDAEDKAQEHMDSEMRELFSGEYDDLIDDYGDDVEDEQAYTISSIEVFNETHDCWKYFKDETQSQFFPLIE